MRPETLEKHRQQGSPGAAQPAWVPFTLSSVGSDSVLSLPPGGAIGQGWDASLPSSTGETWRVSSGREDGGRGQLSLQECLGVWMSWTVIN